MTHLSIASIPRPRPVVTLSAIDSEIAKLVALQKQAEKLDLQASQLRASIREAMSHAGLASYQAPGGHRASLFTSSRFNVDRNKLKAILSPQDLAVVLKPVTTTVLRVR